MVRAENEIGFAAKVRNVLASATPLVGVVGLLVAAVLVGAFIVWSDGRREQVQSAIQTRDLARDVDRWLTDAALLRQGAGASSRSDLRERASAIVAAAPERIALLREAALAGPAESHLRAQLQPRKARIDQLLREAAPPADDRAGDQALLALREAAAQWSGVADHDLHAARERADAAGAKLKITLIGLIGSALVLCLALGRDFYHQRRESAAQQMRARQEAESLSQDLASSRQELEAVNERLELALAAARIVVFTEDMNFRFEWVSRGDFGRLPEDFEGRSDEEVLGATAAAQMRAAKESALETGKVARCEIGLIDRGAPRRIELHVRPLSSASGAKGLLGAMIDVTERHLDRESNRWLMGELSHRTQNLLAIVQSMARHTARGSTDVRAFLARFCERLAALSACHHLLVRASFRGVDMGELVRSQLLGAEVLVGSRVQIDGPPLIVRPDAAQTLAMTISELAANALSFGALAREEGRVDISWSADANPDGDVHLVWRELAGQGAPQAEASRHRGFGSVVIEQMTPRALGAQVTQESLTDGWRCVILAPLRRVTAIEEDASAEPLREPAHAHDVGPT